MINTKYSLFENNIFVFTYHLNYVSNSNFLNNSFNEEITFPYGTNVGTNNFPYYGISGTFLNADGGQFSYSKDYHLQESFPGKNGGTDGTDIGIYGGQYPWKEGSIPFNPHIQLKNISGNTDQNGNLNVNIKVAAQDH